MTSTADLSIFSGGGQKSQQQYDLYYDNSGATNDNSNFNCSDIDLHIIEKDDEEEEDGESSPKWVIDETRDFKRQYYERMLKISRRNWIFYDYS